MILRIITPKKLVLEQEIVGITVPSVDGELTILSNHVPLFTALEEGVVRIEVEKGEEFLSIGGGYLETDGKVLHLLVSRAYGQDEIDEQEAEKARKRAEKLLDEVEDEHERQQIMMELRRSMIDLKLLKKVKRRKSIN